MKQTATIVIFFLLLGGFLLGMVFLPDAALSDAERRKLTQVPEISLEGVQSAEYMTQLERYAQDQFPGREIFRRAKATLRYHVLRQRDSNGIYLAGDYAVKIEDTRKADEVSFAAQKINEIYTRYLEGMQVYAAVIPDKHYFTAADFGRPSLDYEALLEGFTSGLDSVQYVDIFDTLSLADYYYSDAHWRQECLGPLRDRLAQVLGVSEDLPAMEDYERQTLSGFAGVYLGQSALPVQRDDLIYLTSPAIQNALVKSQEISGDLPVYAPEKFAGLDGYDVFLHGAQAFLTIENPEAKTERELVIFRDSFGSSFAPLLIDAYSKITLIDLRYVRSDHLGELMDFEDQDVLFLYSTGIVNSGRLLR